MVVTVPMALPEVPRGIHVLSRDLVLFIPYYSLIGLWLILALRAFIKCSSSSRLRLVSFLSINNFPSPEQKDKKDPIMKLFSVVSAIGLASVAVAAVCPAASSAEP